MVLEAELYNPARPIGLGSGEGSALTSVPVKYGQRDRSLRQGALSGVNE